VQGNDLLQIMIQQVMPALQSQGLAIQSTGTPALDGTYPGDVQSVSMQNSISTNDAFGNGLPGGGATFEYQTLDGTFHSISQAQWGAIIKALVNFWYAWIQAVATLIGGGSAALPTQPVTIP
jgi:hypothetical protein